MKFSPYLSLGFVAVALLCSVSGARAEEATPRTIRVSGNAVVKVAPDRGRVSVSVVSRAATAREASEANARASKTVLEKLRAVVKAPGEVRTSGYELGAEYDYNQAPGARGPKLVGYAATNRFAIVGADLDGVGALIAAAVAAGATQIDSIGFFLEDEEKVRRQALLEAGRKARDEAETVARSLGLTLGDVLDASTAGTPTPGPVFLGREKMAMMADAGAPATEMVPGTLEIGAGMTVTFAIR
jgi:uncharacterized protein YggE